MRSPLYGSAAALLIVAGLGQTLAQQPVNDRDPDAARVAETPLRDLNLKKDGIPPLLQAAARNPYAIDGLTSCAAVTAEVKEFDAMLGPDFDAGAAKGKGVTAGKVAEGAVGGLIPFRGLIREASGAASAERQLQIAILAGATRRGFLKGLGVQRGCASPAKPATLQHAVTLRN